MYQKVKTAKGSSKEMYKQRCTQILKQKKMYEQQLKQYMSHQNTLDQLAFTKDNIQNTLEMGHVMKNTVEQQKALFNQINMDELEDIRDQMEDMKFETDYMNELMSRDYDTNVDDIDLDAEMQDIDNEFYQEVIKKPQIKQPQQVNPSVQKESGYKNMM
jgi:charged multivesicular body protein 5